VANEQDRIIAATNLNFIVFAPSIFEYKKQFHAKYMETLVLHHISAVLSRVEKAVSISAN